MQAAGGMLRACTALLVAATTSAGEGRNNGKWVGLSSGLALRAHTLSAVRPVCAHTYMCMYMRMRVRSVRVHVMLTAY